MLRTLWSVAATGDLISGATDEELRSTQRYAFAMLQCFQHCAEEDGDERCESATGLPVAQANKFGPPLFFLILAMLRSGQRAELDFAVREVRSIIETKDAGGDMDKFVRRTTPVRAGVGGGSPLASEVRGYKSA